VAKHRSSKVTLGLAFLLLMLLLANLAVQTEAVPASVKSKIVAQQSQLCKHFSDTVDSRRMKHRSFARANDEFPNVRQVRSIDNDTGNVSLASFRDNASESTSTSLEATDIKASVQKESDKVYLHVNGETM
jgi:hypothetical protein